MTEATDAMLGRWQAHARSGEPLDVAAEFVGLTLRIVGRALLGIDLGGEADQIGPAMTTALEYLEYRLTNLLSSRPPCRPRGTSGPRALRTLDAVVFEIIAARRREPDRDTGDLLAMLLATRDEETGRGPDRPRAPRPGPDVHRRRARDHGRRAGLDVYLLSQHPEAEPRLRAEVAEVLGGPHARRRGPAAAGIHPPGDRGIAPALSAGLCRAARRGREDEIGGFRIPARSMVILSPVRHPPSSRVLARPRNVRPRPIHPGALGAGPGSPGIRSWAVRTSASARSSP